jgi:serine/threonine protein kinase/Tfp pilus assembly protein PilF
MVDGWRAGDRRPVEQFLDRFPDLWHRPDAALELIAEELALREECGDPATAAELAGRFPQWADQVRALYDCQRLLGPRFDPPEFPAAGEDLGEFRLLAEIGRGAHGKVFLATQPALAERPVVLKLSPDVGGEHLSLARLQHTHIVPLYSAHEFPDRGLRGLCLPYFGGLPLSALLAEVGDRPPAARRGSDLVAALHRSGVAAPVPAAVRGAACEFLERAAYAEAICWVGACLADALQYAHDRGLLHLDLKPSNVLLAADGVPMLLDFHLARPPLAAGDPAPRWLGGSPAYMPPEHRAAMQAVRDGGIIPTAVDARSDIFSLGVLLSEALGHRPDDGCPAEVSVGLADILARCMAAAPADRYPTAADLAGDLRRHLSDLPLRGVGNRDPVERWAKWRRRRPYSLPLIGTLTALLAAGVGFILHATRQADLAVAALRDGEDHLHQRRYPEAVEAFRGGEALISGWPFYRQVADRLRDGRQLAERGKAAADLHALCERVRPMYAAGELTPAQAETVAARCRDLWGQRDLIAARLAGQPDPDLETRWQTDLRDVGILAAHLEPRAVPPEATAAAHRRALEILDQAEALLRPSGAIYLERAAHAKALGMTGLRADAEKLAGTMPPRTALEHVAAGRAYLGAGDLRQAEGEMNRALELDPGSVWANYFKGICGYRLGKPTVAVAAFSACAALAPNSAWCQYNLGLAFGAAGGPDEAFACYDRALVLEPGLVAAWLGRAAVHAGKKQSADALADVQRAANAGLAPAEVAYQKALIHLATNNRPAGEVCLRECLALAPQHAEARKALDRLKAER